MRPRIFFLLALLAIVALSIVSLLIGPAHVDMLTVWHALTGQGADDTASFIITESRLPRLLTALLAGASLGVGGLLMQTVLENPLAEPGILGISSGASLGAAIAMMLPGAYISGAITTGGTVTTIALALVGSLVVTALIAMASAALRSNLMVLITGIMISYLVGSLTSILSFYSTDYGVQTFILWGMGDFGTLPASRLSAYAIATLLTLLPLPLMSRHLDALTLGRDYATTLGINVGLQRTLLLIICGWLTATTTAACGPIAFIGLAAPHAARFILRRSNHSLLLPATALTGTLLTLTTSILCHLPQTFSDSLSTTLPINAVTPLIGVPVVIALIIR